MKNEAEKIHLERFGGMLSIDNREMRAVVDSECGGNIAKVTLLPEEVTLISNNNHSHHDFRREKRLTHETY